MRVCVCVSVCVCVGVRGSEGGRVGGEGGARWAAGRGTVSV